MTRACACLFALVLVASPVHAQTPPPAAAAPATPQFAVVDIGALSYLQYDAELKNRDAYNVFDVTRAYLNINARLTPRVRFRFTPDIRRVTDSSLAGSLVLRVKYAFGQLDNPTTERSWIRFGLHQTPWLDFEESINRYRVQGTMFSEREGLIPGSADFGVSSFMPFGGGLGEVQGGVFNGEGFTQAEPNKYKSAQGRLTIRPFFNGGILRGLRGSVFYNAGWYAADRPRRLGIVMGSFEHPHVVATAQYLKAKENPLPTLPADIDRNGWSVFFEPRQGPAGWAGILRYDSLDPDEAITVNNQNRLILGTAYWIVRGRVRIGLVATDEQVDYQAPARPDENRLLLQTHFEF